MFDPFRDEQEPAPRPDPDATSRYGLGNADVTKPATPPSPGGDRTTFMPPVGPGDDATRRVSPPGSGQREMFPAGDSTTYLPPVPPGGTRATASVPPAQGGTSVMPAGSAGAAGPIRGSASVPPAGGYGGGGGGGDYGGNYGGSYGDDYDDQDDDYGPPPEKRRGGRTALIVVGVILAIVLVTALGVIAGTALFGGGSPTAAPSNSPSLPVVQPTQPASSSPSPSTSPSGLGPRILSFEAPSRVDCADGAGDTQVTLKWEVKNATKVELKMDGKKVDDYGSDDSPSVTFPCDKVGHRYTIVAISDDGTRSKSKSVSVRPKTTSSTDGNQTTGDVGNDGNGGTGQG